MKTTTTTSALVVTLLGTIASFAVASAPINGSPGIRQVVSSGVHETGHLTFTLQGTAAEWENSGMDGCDPEGGVNAPPYRFVLNPDAPALKEMYATVLTAQATGKRLYVWAQGCRNIYSTYGLPQAISVSLRE